MKRKRIKLKDVQRESIALFDFAIAEAYARGSDVHYRISFPYGPIKPDETMDKNTKMVVDFSVYFDAPVTDEQDDEKKFTILDPIKRRH